MDSIKQIWMEDGYSSYQRIAIGVGKLLAGAGLACAIGRFYLYSAPAGLGFLGCCSELWFLKRADAVRQTNRRRTGPGCPFLDALPTYQFRCTPLIRGLQFGALGYLATLWMPTTVELAHQGFSAALLLRLVKGGIASGLLLACPLIMLPLCAEDSRIRCARGTGQSTLRCWLGIGLSVPAAV